MVQILIWVKGFMMSNDGLWERFRVEIQDEFKKNKESFLTGKVTSRCLHPRTYPIQVGLKYVNYVGGESHLIPDPDTGNPSLVEGKNSIVSFQSAVYIKMMKENGLLDVDAVNDIGGGYGNLAWMMRSMGFDKPYTIFDFEEIHKLQDYFLKQNNIYDINLDFLSNINPIDNSLLIGTHSINEMPLTAREIIPFERYKSILIAHNHNFNDVDNIEYFMKLGKRLESLGWDITRTKSPIQGAQHFFFIGKRND